MAFGRFNRQLLHFQDENPQRERTIVFANSLGTDLRIWDNVVAHCAGDFRTLRYDLRGHGLSEAPPAPYAIEPTKLGSIFFCSAHEMLHSGQIGLIRRLLGRPPLR